MALPSPCAPPAGDLREERGWIEKLSSHWNAWRWDTRQAPRAPAGVDEKKGDKLTDELTVILSRAHAMSDAEFKAKRGELDKQIHALLGGIGPLDVMRSVTERSLAELLSNPRLPAALQARLKDAK